MSEEASPKSARARIADVAKAAGVSTTTVSHALSNSGRVNEQTRNRVLAAAVELGYRPSPRATALRRGRSRTIAIASNMHTAVAGGASRQGFYLELAAAAAERAFEYGYALVLVPPFVDGDAEQLSGLAVDGLLVVEPAEADPIIGLARRDGTPFVSLGTYPDASDQEPQVALPTDEAAALVLDHLRSVGVHRPALLIGDRHRTSYAAIERAYGEQPWPQLVARVAEADGEEGGYRATLDLLRQEPTVDAVLAWVDAFAVGAARAATELGRDIPGDLRIVTRYYGPRARAHRPQLTAVNLHLAQAAVAGVDRLLRLLGEEIEAPRGIPAPQLICRASSPAQ